METISGGEGTRNMASQRYERFQEQLHLFQRFRNRQSNGLIYTKVLMAYNDYAHHRSLSAQRLRETPCILWNQSFLKDFFKNERKGIREMTGRPHSSNPIKKVGAVAVTYRAHQ